MRRSEQSEEIFYFLTDNGAIHGAVEGPELDKGIQVSLGIPNCVFSNDLIELHDSVQWGLDLFEVDALEVDPGAVQSWIVISHG